MITGFFCHRHNLVVAVVKGRACEVVHRGVDDHEILNTGSFHVLHARDQDAGVAGDEAARLDQNPQAKRLEQWQQLGRVLGRGEQFFPLG